MICHADVVGIGLKIFWRSHDRELDGTLVSERLVRPFSYRPDLLDGCNTVVRDQNLEFDISSAIQSRPTGGIMDKGVSMGEGERGAHVSDDCVAVMFGNKVFHF
mgnify:FL=1